MLTLLAATTVGSASCEVSPVAAVNYEKLSGPQIGAKVRRDAAAHGRGALSTARCEAIQMGTKKVGKWAVEKDQLCLYLRKLDDGCYEASLSGSQIEMKPATT